VFTVTVPPLRDLGEDKRKLLVHFAEFYAAQSGAAEFKLDAAAEQLWMDYSFPGNVRELRNIVIRLTTKHAGETVSSEQLFAELDPEQGAEPAASSLSPEDHRSAVETAKRLLLTQRHFRLDEALQRFERSYVEAALALTSGNLSQAAKLLGVHRTTLYSRMQGYSAQVGNDRSAPDQS